MLRIAGSVSPELTHYFNRFQMILRSIPIALVFLVFSFSHVNAGEEMIRDARVVILERDVRTYLENDRITAASNKSDELIKLVKSLYGDAHLEYANALYLKAVTLMRAGKDLEAFDCFQTSLNIRSAQLPKNDPKIANVLNSMGVVQFRAGHLDEAETYYHRTLEARIASLAPNDPSIAVSHSNLGDLYRIKGDLDKAKAHLYSALSILESSPHPDPQQISFVTQNLSALCLTSGQPEEAEALMGRAISLQVKSGYSETLALASAKSTLANIYFAENRAVDAERVLLDVLKIRRHLLPPQHADIAAVLNNLGLAQTQLGRYSDAERYLQEALQINRAVLAPDHEDIAIGLENLAIVEEAKGKIGPALRHQQAAFKQLESTLYPQSPHLVTAATNWSRLEFKSGNKSKALDLVRKAVTIAADGSFALPKAVAAHMAYAWDVATHKPSEKEHLLQESFWISQREAQSSTAAAITQMALRFSTKDAGLTKLVRERQNLEKRRTDADKELIAALSKPLSSRNGQDKNARLELANIDTSTKVLDERLKAEFPQYVALVNPQPLKMEDAQALLAPDEGLLCFYAFDDAVYTFVVTAQDRAWYRSPISSRELARKVAAFRAGLESDGQPFDLLGAYDLYTLLLGPASGIVGRIQKLIIVPSGVLTSLPFHLLVTAPAAAGRDRLQSLQLASWLFQRHAISIVPSISSLRSLRSLAKPSYATKALVGFADPVVRASIPSSTSRGPYDLLESLPGTRRELTAVAATVHASDGDLFFGDRASERQLKSLQLSDYRIIYFATHALVGGSFANLDEPALVLSRPAATDKSEDGLLTASEVARLHLDADWVVLSACNTASGAKLGAEPLSGLARAFFYAGARALLVSHWAVDDITAPKLASKIFSNLADHPTMGRAQALQLAMQSVLDGSQTVEDAEPRNWGPFILVGDGRPL